MGNCLVTKLKGIVNNSNLPKITDYENSVDLGLPSGLRWGKKNIDLTTADKFAASEIQYMCSYFSWGNLDGYNPVNDSFSNIYTFDATAYSSTPGAALLENLPDGQDAARYILGGNWRMPTKEELSELNNNTVYVDADGEEISGTNKLITIDGVVGVRRKSIINGNTVFFPCSGFGANADLTAKGSIGIIPTRTKYDSSECICYLFNSNTIYAYSTSYKYRGMSIRPVIKF